MKVATLKDTELDSSNVTEALYSEWLVGTAYVLDDYVYVTLDEAGTTEVTPHKIYKALGATTGDYPPDNPADWEYQGATNRWKMFDGSPTSQTENADEITVEVDSSNTNVVGFFNLDADEIELTLIQESELFTNGDGSTDSFTKGDGWGYGTFEYDCDGSQTTSSILSQTNATIDEDTYAQIVFTVSGYSAGNIAGYAGGTSGDLVSANGTYTQIILAGSTTEFGVIADTDFIGTVDDLSLKFVPKYETIDLSFLLDADYYSYFFAPFEYKQNIAWYYPLYGNSTLRANICQTGGTAKCGLLVVARSTDIGLSQWQPTTGIIDYSIKSTDSFGNTILTQGNFADRFDIETQIENNSVDAIRRTLTNIRGTPALFDGNNDDSDYESLVVYGYYEKFDIIIPNVSFSTCNIRIQGLT